MFDRNNNISSFIRFHEWWTNNSCVYSYVTLHVQVKKCNFQLCFWEEWIQWHGKHSIQHKALWGGGVGGAGGKFIPEAFFSTMAVIYALMPINGGRRHVINSG